MPRTSRIYPFLVIALCLTIASAAIAQPVQVKVEKMTKPISIILKYHDHPQRLMYAAPKDDSAIGTADHTFEMITLSNNLVEVKVAPALAMRVINAVDLKTGRSFAGTPDARQPENSEWKDVLAFTAGYQEFSFPYFEHGTGVIQPAGYRIINNPDGSVSVAMNIRFTHHQQPRHSSRYGRYSQRSVSAVVTLRPGEGCYHAWYRVDNPLPLGRSNRIWVNMLMHGDAFDANHIIYPAGYVMQHGGQEKDLRAFHAEGGEPGWQNVSHFALYPDYGFCGVYSAERDTNCLIVLDPKVSPGMKLYTTKNGSGFMEIWTGTTPVFEDPGKLLNGFESAEYAMTFYNVSGVGKVEYANEKVALAVRDGQFAVITPAAGKGEVRDADGNVLAAGEVSLHSPLRGRIEDRLVIVVDGALVADVTLPLRHTDTRPLAKDVAKQGGKFRLEMEEISNHIGAPTSRDAVPAARKLVAAGEIADGEYAMSLARTVYRYGHLDLAENICQMVGPNAESDLLRGLIAWERGGEVDFGQAGIDANYHRALLAVQQKRTAEAVKLLDELIAARPLAYRPRLMRAYLAKDAAAARQLAAENPAYPEAQLVLHLLGNAPAEAEMQKLLANNPDAAEQVEQFRLEITEGKWQHPRRYEPMLPKADQTTKE